MDILIPNVAGIDVHKEVLVITTLKGEAGQKVKVEQFSCPTFTDDLRACAQKMVSEGIKHIAMESTGIFWKPVYNIFHAEGLIVTLGNATHMKNVPGRKTDMKDSHWIAYLHRHGFIRPSFIPEEEFQDLRLLTRHRVTLLQEKSRIKNRVQKILEDGNIKLSSVINDVFGVGGRAVLDKISVGVTDAKELANAVKTNIKRKEDLEKSLSNCLRPVHTFLIKELLLEVDSVNTRAEEIDNRINQLFTPHEDIINRLCEIPGISRTASTQILAETSNNLSTFKDDRHFAAWAGVAPGNNESAKKKRKSRTRQGNPALKCYLVQSAVGAIKKKNSFYRAKHNQLRFSLGSYNKATVAIANKLARVIYHIIKNPKKRYKELGEFRADKKEQQTKRAVNKLKALGYQVTLTEVPVLN